jgi:predicted dehydrogenase
MSAPILRTGIAGYGTVGKIRHKFADLHPNLRVMAVCDQSFESPFTSAEGYHCWSNYEQLLAEPLDILFVCLPNYLAPEVTMAGLERGLHVFCEKPPGRDLSDIAQVIECERGHPGQKLMYGFNHRYHHSVREALRIVRSGELGEIINMRGVYGKSKIIRFDSDWRTKRAYSGGGILLDQGIHMVDMMRLFAQDDFNEIHSSVSNSYWRHDVEDNAYALMRTTRGIVAMLHSSATSWRHRFHLDITLTRGSIILSGILSSTKSYGAETITVVSAGEDDGGDPCEQMTRYNEDVSWREEISDFADAVLNDKEIIYGSSLEALKTMELVFRIYGADPSWSQRYGIQAELPLTIHE